MVKNITDVLVEKTYTALNKKLLYWGFTPSLLLSTTVIVLLSALVIFFVFQIILGAITGLIILAVYLFVLYFTLGKTFRKVHHKYKEGHPSFFKSRKVFQKTPRYLIDTEQCINMLLKSDE